MSRIAGTEDFIAATVESDILVAIVIVVAIALGMADTFSSAVGYEDGAIGHDVVVSKIGESPGENFLNFYVHEILFLVSLKAR